MQRKRRNGTCYIEAVGKRERVIHISTRIGELSFSRRFSVGMWVTRSSLFCAAKNIHRSRPSEKEVDTS